MVTVLTRIIAASARFLEAAGALAILAAVWLLAGFPWALLGAGVMALLKSAELELRSSPQAAQRGER